MPRMALALVMAVIGAGLAHAEADGPDFYTVRGIQPGATLAVREQPSTEAPQVGEIPATGYDIRNLGCQNAPSFTEWAKMSEAERQAAAGRRWCRVRYGAIEGWVEGRHLVEQAGRPAAGAGAAGQ